MYDRVVAPNGTDEPTPRGFATRAIRAAARQPALEQRPTAVPIYQSATFTTADADELGSVLLDERPGYAYSRIDNPTVHALADAVAELEGAEAGYAFATGMAAIHATLVSLLGAGDRIVATQAVYGSTRALLAGLLTRLGVATTWVDIADHDAVERALAAAPARVLYAETISNPTIVVADHAALAAIARRRGATYVVDNTFASPWICRPLELGADLVVESATKYLGGHSDVLAGVVSGDTARIEAIRAVGVDTGGSLAPLSAFLVLRGLTTLALRMERHSATASALAGWLARQDGVTRVHHASLPEHPQHDLASRQLRAAGGMLAFELDGGRVAGRAFIDALRFTERTASLGSVHTIVAHPSSTTHRQLDDVALATAGIGPGLLRASTGLEDLEDLTADFGRGLEAARASAPPAEPGSADRRAALAAAAPR